MAQVQAIETTSGMISFRDRVRVDGHWRRVTAIPTKITVGRMMGVQVRFGRLVEFYPLGVPVSIRREY